MAVRYVTFDCYGTLIDWKRGIEYNFKKFTGLQDKYNQDIFDEYVKIESRKESGYSTYREILASTFLELERLNNIDPSDKDAGDFAESITHWPPFDDTVTTLVDIGKMGLKRIILSNVDRDLLKETISENELEVDGYITAEDVRSYKPSKAHWMRMLEEYDAKEEEVVHVAGSIYHDIVPASKMGFKTIWVNRYSEKTPNGVKPNYTVDRLSDIINILLNF
ncbi:MAG: haloacid dehalogenase type II [Thermoplasmata archaeon]